MNAVKSLHRPIGIALAIAFLMGCKILASTPVLPPPTPTLSPPTPSLPPSIPTSSSPAVAQTATAPTAQPGLLEYIRTVPVTPDDQVQDGGFIRLGYVPGLDQIVAAFKSWKLTTTEGSCKDGAHLVKAYTLDLQPAGGSHVINCGSGVADSSALFVENVMYDVYFSDQVLGWHITKFDALTWKTLAETDYDLGDPQKVIGDMSIELVNGMLDVSSMIINPGENPSIPTATHHSFFTPDLQFLNMRVLADIEHIEGSSTLFLDETIYFITGDNIHGDVIVMEYDTAWKYLGMKTLQEHGTWPEGAVFDGERFYVAYMDTSLDAGTDFIPLNTNIHLAAFDRDWNFLAELAVTDYTVADDVEVWRPYLALHGSRLYVSYDVVPHDPTAHTELPMNSQAYIAVYELNAAP